LSSTAYEWLALFIFICSRCFADKHQFSSRITHAENDLLAPLLVQAAPSAIADVFPNKAEPGSRIGCFYKCGAGALVRLAHLTWR
jgi:hypothetical protein